MEKKRPRDANMRERDIYVSVCKFGLWRLIFFVGPQFDDLVPSCTGVIPVKDGKHFVWRCGLESTLFEQICVEHLRWH